MTTFRKSILLSTFLACCLTAIARAEPALPLLGKIKPRSASGIQSSSWSVGGETQDRDYTTYANYSKYLGPLGAKGLRLQAGWAKCEKVPGVYDFKWLDEVVDDALSQGVQPWLQLSYGNPIHPGGGDTGLGGGFPSSPEALAAWDRWVEALVTHFKDRVHEWEIWNEPDLNTNDTATVEAYIPLYIRTAGIIRGIQPKGKSRIYALALCHSYEYAEKFIEGMTKLKKLDLIDAVTFHTYPLNPDDTLIADKLLALVKKADSSIQLRQGETGATSKRQPNYALKNLDWTENMQAKWNLRRMLAHHGKGIPFSLFSMIDLHYQRDGRLDMNYKGLLASKEDQTVDHVKPAYFAAQNVFAIFDDSLVPMKNFPHKAGTDRKIAATAYRNASGAQVIALWFNGEPVVDSNSPTPVDFKFPKSRFKEPVYVDLLTGDVRALPPSTNGDSFKNLPIYDSPILIAEKSALPIEAK